MRIWKSDHTFEHPWEKVVAAAYQKYPNPHNKQVFAIDVLERQVDTRGRLLSHRVLTAKWPLPQWCLKFLSDPVTQSNEHSILDLKEKTLTLKSRNYTLANVITYDEQLVYSPDPNDSKRTILKQEAKIECCSPLIGGKIEKLLETSTDANAAKGRQAMEWVIDRLSPLFNDFTAQAQTDNMS